MCAALAGGSVHAACSHLPCPVFVYVYCLMCVCVCVCMRVCAGACVQAPVCVHVCSAQAPGPLLCAQWHHPLHACCAKTPSSHLARTHEHRPPCRMQGRAPQGLHGSGTAAACPMCVPCPCPCTLAGILAGFRFFTDLQGPPAPPSPRGGRGSAARGSRAASKKPGPPQQQPSSFPFPFLGCAPHLPLPSMMQVGCAWGRCCKWRGHATMRFEAHCWTCQLINAWNIICFGAVLMPCWNAYACSPWVLLGHAMLNATAHGKLLA